MTEDWNRRLITLASIVAGMALWEVVGQNSNRAFIAPMSDTVLRLYELVMTGDLLQSTTSSMSLFFAGFVLAVVIGVPLGILLARVQLLRIALENYITILYSTPMVVLIPFILTLMGFGFAPKVLVVFLFAVFPILYNTFEGARSMGPELTDVARVFRSSERDLWRDVIMPYTLPFVATGMRQGIARGMVGMVSAEFFLSPSGLGQLIMVGSYNFDTAGMLAAVSVVVALGLVLMQAARYVELRVSAWRWDAQ